MNKLRLLPLAFLGLGCASLADETMEAVFAASVGDWDGQLYYLDYQSGERFGIPMRVSASVTPDGVTLKRELTYTDPGVLVHAVNLLTVDRDTGELVEVFFREGRGELFRFDIVSATYEGPEQWQMVYEQAGIDDDRPARIRHTMTRNGTSMDSTKEVSFADSDGEFFLRNGSELRLIDTE